MWENNFSRMNKELIIDRLGKNPYSRELTNLMLTRIDMETTFMHHALPGAIDLLYSLFGDIDLGTSYVSALEVLKKYYKEGEVLYHEYLKYLGDLGAVNITDENKEEFLRERMEDNQIENISHSKKLMEVYTAYQYGLFNIVRLDEKIEEMQRLSDEYQKDHKSDDKKHRKMKISQILSYINKGRK